MKPSDRINKIYGDLAKEGRNKPLTEFLNAICQYLDEEYEKKHPKCFCKEIGCDKNEHTYKAEIKKS